MKVALAVCGIARPANITVRHCQVHLYDRTGLKTYEALGCSALLSQFVCIHLRLRIRMVKYGLECQEPSSRLLSLQERAALTQTSKEKKE